MTTLPATISEPQIIEIVASEWVPRVRSKMGGSREWLIRTLGDYLRRGLMETQKVVDEADKGDELSDHVLRLTFAQMLDVGEMPGATLRAYNERAILRPPHKRKPGRHTWYENWRRNIGICTLIGLVCDRFGLTPTREQESRRANRLPSGCSVVQAALARNGLHISEGTIQNIWSGVVGDLFRVAAESFTLIIAE